RKNAFQKSSSMAPMQAEILFGQGFGCNLLQPIAANGPHLSLKLKASHLPSIIFHTYIICI
ncbi:hypothetical protein, partial [Flavobacterium sp.]|uniref:hypothetical protein n=1 Tax=Flavobacterium sp. TaxID=239 RepID=UPI0031D607C2